MNDDELTALLEQLPTEATPPPLPDRVYAMPTERPTKPWWIGGVLLAAAILLALLLPSSSEPVVLLTGETVVDGTLEVLTPGSRIALDGRARILVEPAPSLLRAHEQNLEDPMLTRELVAGLAGIAVTVVVYEGSALVHADTTEPIALHAGERQTFQGAPTRASVATPTPAVVGSSEAPRVRALEAELAEAKRALAEQTFTNELLKGQLKAGQGEPAVWPTSGVPADFQREVFEERLAEKVGGIEHLEIDRVDCSEFPCLATLHYTGDSTTMEWAEDALSQLQPWIDASWEDASITSNNSGFGINGRRESYMTLGVHGSPADDALDERLRWRVDQVVEQLGDELRQDLADAPVE